MRFGEIIIGGALSSYTYMTPGAIGPSLSLVELLSIRLNVTFGPCPPSHNWASILSSTVCTSFGTCAVVS